MIIDPNKFKITSPTLISFEGGNAVGKSTLIKAVADFLLKQGKSVVQTREPGGTDLGVKIRQIVKEGSELNIAPLAELFLFAADRAQHVNTLIKPSIEKGSYVLTDRYYHSTLAFQGAGRKIDSSVVKASIDFAISGVKPGLVVLIDLPIEESAKRANKRQDLESDRFENENSDFQNKIRQSFLDLAAKSTQSWIVLDGMKSKEELSDSVIKLFA